MKERKKQKLQEKLKEVWQFYFSVGPETLTEKKGKKKKSKTMSFRNNR